jgi:hypothetical protein
MRIKVTDVNIMLLILPHTHRAQVQTNLSVMTEG